MTVGFQCLGLGAVPRPTAEPKIRFQLGSRVPGLFPGSRALSGFQGCKVPGVSRLEASNAFEGPRLAEFLQP